MNRNLDVVRHVLIVAMDRQKELPLEDAMVAEHVVLLIDEGYLEGAYVREGAALGYLNVIGLTEKGDALLEAVRQDAIWSKTKRVLGAALERMSLETVRATANTVEKYQDSWEID